MLRLLRAEVSDAPAAPVLANRVDELLHRAADRDRAGCVRRLSCRQLDRKKQVWSKLETAAEAGVLRLAGLWSADGPPPIGRTPAASLSERLGCGSTVILPSGKVIADSGEDPAVLDNHRERPEVVQALSGETGRSTRPSASRQEFVHVSWRCRCGTRGRSWPSCGLRSPRRLLTAALWNLYAEIAAAGLLAVFLITDRQSPRHAAAGPRHQRDPPRRRSPRPRPVEIPSTG